MEPLPGETRSPLLAAMAPLRWVSALGAVIGLLVIVYVPAFALIRVLHVAVDRMVPLVIVITAVLASLYALILSASAAFTVRQFGLRLPRARQALVAAAIGVAPAIAVALLLSRSHENGPLVGLTVSPALMWLYFALLAPLQEEWIFRGLMQAVAARLLAPAHAIATQPRAGAAVIAAFVFAAVHLTVGPWTAAAALLLGLLAGEARRRSESLLPAVLIHALFNISALLVAMR